MPAKKTTEWRCFHCGFETSDPKEAEAHFGERDDASEFLPLCRWWKSTPDADRAAEYQGILQELNGERDENIKLRTQIERLVSESRRARVQAPLWKGIASTLLRRAKRIRCQFGGDHSIADCHCDPHELGEVTSTMQEEFDRGSSPASETPLKKEDK